MTIAVYFFRVFRTSSNQWFKVGSYLHQVSSNLQESSKYPSKRLPCSGLGGLNFQFVMDLCHIVFSHVPTTILWCGLVLCYINHCRLLLWSRGGSNDNTTQKWVIRNIFKENDTYINDSWEKPLLSLTQTWLVTARRVCCELSRYISHEGEFICRGYTSTVF